MSGNHPARETRATTAERRRVVGVIVTAGMHHQAAAVDVAELEPRSEHGIAGLAIGVDIERWQIADEEHPVGGQLMGSDPAEFAVAARELAAAGFDVIDINFGCPVKKVLGRCRGGYHLGQPDVALEIVSRVREAVPLHIPVSVKMRRGLDDTEAPPEPPAPGTAE